jgi:hypothetical protein
MGASSAENEFQELGNYYLETDEFRQTLRGEIQIVIGRKGSGKTALFFQVRDRLRGDRDNVILDLKPEGFQLIKFKEQVLDYLEKGTQEHTITAFWEYLLLLEICHKLLQNDRTRHVRDLKLYVPYRNLESIYNTDEYVAEGDFAERMLKLTGRIADDFRAAEMNKEKGLRLSSEEITEFIYKHNISELRAELTKYLQYKKALWILFDNLDKGWPPHGITREDALNLRCLIDAISKLERSFRRQHLQAKGVLFVRNDVYERLVAITPDRGKVSHALVDWTDEALLLELLRKRFVYSIEHGDPSFDFIWRQICVSHIRGEETSHYMIERCLMRPRSLIDFLRFCRSHAVNLGHQRIQVEDLDNGEEQYSTQLVNDISYEIKDVFPPAKDVLYEFIECPSEFDEDFLSSALKKAAKGRDIERNLFDILLWYGVIGFRKENGESVYVYSVRYDMKRLNVLLDNRSRKGLIYVINPAFWKGLEVVRH